MLVRRRRGAWRSWPTRAQTLAQGLAQAPPTRLPAPAAQVVLVDTPGIFARPRRLGPGRGHGARGRKRFVVFAKCESLHDRTRIALSDARALDAPNGGSTRAVADELLVKGTYLEYVRVCSPCAKVIDVVLPLSFISNKKR